jgi:hypothetical protein
MDYRGRLRAVRAERDSLLEWLEGEYDARQRGRGTITHADSSRIEAQFARFARAEGEALVDSARCAQPILVRLFAHADSLIREQGGPEFEWTDVPSGVYRLRGFRDINGNAVRDAGEPEGAYPFAIEVAPLRAFEDLMFAIELPEGETLLQPPEAGSASSAREQESP